MKFRIVCAILIASLLLVSCKKDDTGNADKSSGKLYVRSLYSLVTGGVSIDWYYLGNNGDFVKNPKNGIPIDMVAEKKNNQNNTGTYSIYESDGRSFIKIIWWSGDVTAMGLKYEKGDIVEMDIMGTMLRQPGLPQNYKLNGMYNSMSTDLSFKFLTDGSLIFKDYNVDTYSWESYPGNYEIAGSNLKLNFSDDTIFCLIAVLDDGNLIINREYYEKQ